MCHTLKIKRKSVLCRICNLCAYTAIEHNQGLDNFVMSKAPTKLSPELRKVRKEIEASKAAK